MANPVLITDLEARFRPLVGNERTVAQSLIDDAWAIACTQLPALASSTAPDGTVRAVIAGMIVRVLRNPEGLRSFTSDDASFTRDNAVSSGGLYLSADELALLSTAVGGARRGAFSIAAAQSEPVAPGSEWPYRYPPGMHYGSTW